MRSTTVTELPRHLEAVSQDTFLDGSGDSVPSQPRSPSSPLRRRHHEEDLGALVRAARTGDNAAWTRLVEQFDPGLRSIARGYRLAPADIDDVLQTTWLRLFTHIEALREPSAVAGWLATTTRREAMRVLQSSVREQLTDDPDGGEATAPNGPESELLAAERRTVLGRALATLPDRHRRLITLLAADPAVAYDEISAALAMPIGSIGPIRARSFARLVRHPELRGLQAGESLPTAA